MLLLPAWAPHRTEGRAELTVHTFLEEDLPEALRASVTAVRLGASPVRPAGNGSLESLLASYAAGADQPAWLHDLMALVFQARPWTLEKLSDRVGLSPAYLTTQVRRWTGRSLMQWSLQARLDEAAAQLATGTVAQAAACAGFNDLAHFRRLFRRQYRTTPKEYREHIR